MYPNITSLVYNNIVIDYYINYILVMVSYYSIFGMGAWKSLCNILASIIT